MGAITGIMQLNKTPINFAHARSLMRGLEHYPSDTLNMWRSNPVFFGCLHQWITPESIGEKLPFYNYERQLVITSDAMIDNREELSDKLRIDLERRKVLSDSQLILLAYSKWGEEVPKHLIGDFAFMIWDEKEHKLFGARDFSGARPLYYHVDDRRFTFSTVIEPLLGLPYIKKQLNEDWLAAYLAIPNMIDGVDVSQTPFKDIQQIPPSHTISVNKGHVQIKKYHVLAVKEKIRFKTDDEYIEAFRDVFQKAVNSNLRTFKNVGSQLSGGLDSGAVVSFAAKTLGKQNKKLHTYSSIPMKDFNDYTADDYYPDERPFIKATVDYIGNMEEHYVRIDHKNSYTDIDEWLKIIESPYKAFENSYWIKGIFEEASKNDIGILLSGARGNFTISWGPAFDYYAHLLKRMRWIHFSKELKKYSRNIGVGRRWLMNPISKMAFPFLDREEQYQFPILINSNFAAKTQIYEKLKEYGIEASGIKKQTIQGQKNYLIENNFIWNTNGTTFSKLSLQYGLLIRDPTNDLRVVNYCQSLPLDQFINNGWDRALIRNATKGYLPEKVRLNQKYKGLQGMDWVQRMKKNWQELIEETEALLANPDMMQYFNRKSISSALVKARQGALGEMALDPELRGLMRCIIVSRFLLTFDLKGGEQDEKGMDRTQIGSVGF